MIGLELPAMNVNNELALFLAHAVELEREAAERYQELADTLEVHNNPEVADFFARMAGEARLHLSSVLEHVGDETLPTLQPWEFDWPDPEAPESASYEATNYRMTLRQAISLAMQNEVRAWAYYSQTAERSVDKKTRQLANSYAEEEKAHARELERALEKMSEDPVYHWEDDDDPHLPE